MGHHTYMGPPVMYVITSVKVIKNEVCCRDDTVPKTVDTRRHCEVDLRACKIFHNPIPTSWFSGLRKIVACSQIYLAVPSCIYSFWHGVIPTRTFYFILNDFYTCIHSDPSKYTSKITQLRKCFSDMSMPQVGPMHLRIATPSALTD